MSNTLWPKRRAFVQRCLRIKSGRIIEIYFHYNSCIATSSCIRAVIRLHVECVSSTWRGKFITTRLWEKIRFRATECRSRWSLYSRSQSSVHLSPRSRPPSAILGLWCLGMVEQNNPVDIAYSLVHITNWMEHTQTSRNVCIRRTAGCFLWTAPLERMYSEQRDLVRCSVCSQSVWSRSMWHNAGLCS